jgi:hypothetical protein
MIDSMMGLLVAGRATGVRSVPDAGYTTLDHHLRNDGHPVRCSIGSAAAFDDRFAPEACSATPR